MNEAKNKSLPILLCGEEDVCGAHSSSVGGIDLEKLQPITYDPANHTYLKLGEVVGKAFSDGLKLK